MRRSLAIPGLLLTAAVACQDVGEYSTAMGECYKGEIIASGFVRKGFGTGVTLTLSVDTNALGRGDPAAGYLSTSDGTFRDAPVSQMEPLSHDSLSLFQFPGGRVQNYLAHATPVSGQSALVVISLMENEDVEVRVLRPAGQGDDSSPALFGVFHTVLVDGCDSPGPAGS